ncbi:hypothetical protein ULMS_09290 [Patiriisocius marinistellae]|uniref:Uncharacterized protein n=1 Tax=Patiriisocius marinistellae TaxID=2494560 RepID=A0A5J4G062_9FLAO|nr:hypothetical protein [Patiriisocius marinistellae]GEQ85421.1 hypothetical protein ULMS_09290 [Patiriisocius marinistellae]
MTVKETYQFNKFATTLSLISIILTLVFGYHYLDLHHKKYSYQKISVVLWVTLGALICYVLSIYFKLGSVISAGITGTLASFIPLFNKESVYLKKLPNALYCGAFVGMSSTIIAPSIVFIIAAGCIAGGVYMFSKSLFVGMGGKLGTIAFAGVVTVVLLNWLLL